MSTKDNGGSAFPTRFITHNTFVSDAHGVGTAVPVYSDAPGMSLRDWFAGQALAGLLASTAHPDSTGPDCASQSSWAAQAYSLADAMIEARSK